MIGGVRMGQKKIKCFLLFTIICCFITFFTPFIGKISAEENTYQVNILKADGTSENLGTYTSYNEAKDKMKDTESSKDSVAVIYKNGTLINANYAIAKLIPGYTINIYPTSTSSTKYTYTHTSYGTDAAFLDYDDTTNRMKIKISGCVGWVSASYVNVVPITDLFSNSIKILASTSLRVRREPSLNGEQFGLASQGQIYRYYDKVEADGYTWYKILYNGEYGFVASSSGWTSESVNNTLQTFYEPYSKSNNLIHYFEYANGQSFTNLGPKPSYLENGVSYYSFDGNYFYTDLIAMLDDYKNDTYEHSLNKDTPFFAYYLYLSNHSMSNYEAEDLDGILENSYNYYRAPEEGVTYVDEAGNWISGLDRSGMSVLYKQGSNFIEVQKEYGINALLSYSAALNESAKGTSALAFAKNNIFGHGAYDSCWFSCAFTFSTVKDSIIYHAKLTGGGYNDPTDSRYFGGHYGNKGSGMNVNYASDPYWGEKMAANYYSLDSSLGKQDYLANTIGVKLTSEAVNVYWEPDINSKVLYQLKNKSFDVANMPMTVIDKVTVNGTTFYKINTDTGIDENGNLTNQDYNPNTCIGYVLESDLYVSNHQPTMEVKEIELEVGKVVDYLSFVTASDLEDGNLTESVQIIASNVNINIPGTYEITYRVEDSSKYRVEKTVSVMVKGSNAPQLFVSDKIVSQYTTFDIKKDVIATDYDGTDLTSLIQTEGSVNTQVLGTYEITYTVTNALGKTTSKTIIVTVKENAIPVIEATDKVVKINSDFNVLEGVSASDEEDGNLTQWITIKESNLDLTTPGVYSVTFEVKDSAGNVGQKTIQVTVSNKEEVDGTFYFDYLDNLNDQLCLRGYLTLYGMNNTLEEEIHYQLIFENTENSEITYVQDATRITDLTGINRPIYSPDGYVYTYAWFEIQIDLDALPSGNYIMYVKAESDTTFTKKLVNNLLYKKEITSFEGDKKSVNIKNNYSDRTSAVTFYVRENFPAFKTVDSYYNQYDTWRTFEFVDNKLHLKGVSYSYGMDLSESANVTRKIIFENHQTYETYEYDLGSITNGLYTVALPVNDNLDKTRAWYDAFLDLSDLPIGEYTIYLTTTSNITDLCEFTDIMGRSLEDKTITMNGKTYTFFLNLEKGNIIELKVE